MAGINPAINLATPQFGVGGVPAQATPQVAGQPALAGLPTDVANMTPEQLTQTVQELQTLVQQLQGGAKKKGGGLASQYLRGNGSFTVKPLEKGVQVKKADDSEYWAALGYNA